MVRALIGADSKLRPLWRGLSFYILGTYALNPLLGWPFDQLSALLGVRPGLTPGTIAVGEIRIFIVALILTTAFAIYEHHRIDDYGLPIAGVLKQPTLEGLASGLLTAGAVGIGMLTLRGMQVQGWNGPGIATSALAWLGVNICVGVAEEAFYRGYLLQTLWRSIGFWPASVLIALVFAAAHYFYKPGENVWDVVTLVSISLLLSYSVWRTGTLWFAVGWHVAFDFMQLFVIGSLNGSLMPVGRMLRVTFDGPAWLTGGVLGTEASVLMYPAIALLWVYVWWRYPVHAPC